MPKSRHPVSRKQLAANRANAAKSTGPRTPQGKARSARNARKHGFTPSTFAVVRLEDLQEVDHLRADLLAVYQPVNSQELFAIERLALTQQAILRAARLETGLFTTPKIYRTKPFSTPIPNQMKPLNPMKNELISPQRTLLRQRPPDRPYNCIGGTLCHDSAFRLQ